MLVGDDNALPSHPWSDLLKRSRREELVNRLLYSAGITTMVSQPGLGKTTTAMGVGLTTGIGEIFAGQQIKQRPVIWIPGEGLDDLRPMYEAWRQFKRCEAEPQGFYLEDGLDFHSNADDTNKLLRLLEGPPPLIITDALADMIGDGDEDRAKDINRAYRNFWRVVITARASFFVLHHSGWEGTRERGSSAIRAKSDIVIQVTEFDPAAGIMKLKHLKRRGGPKEEFSVEVKLVEVAGFKEPIPVVTGVEPSALTIMLSERPPETERHARQLVQIMLGLPDAEATNGQLKTAWEAQPKSSPSTFNRALNCAAKEKKWFVGGGARNAKYTLNPDESWKAAIGGEHNQQPSASASASVSASLSSSTPYRGVEVNESDEIGVKKVSWNRVDTDTDTGGCENPGSTRPAPQSQYDREIEAMLRAEQAVKAKAAEAASVAAAPVEGSSPEEDLVAAALAHLKKPA